MVTASHVMRWIRKFLIEIPCILAVKNGNYTFDVQCTSPSSDIPSRFFIQIEASVSGQILTDLKLPASAKDSFWNKTQGSTFFISSLRKSFSFEWLPNLVAVEKNRNVRARTDEKTNKETETVTFHFSWILSGQGDVHKREINHPFGTHYVKTYS